MYEVEKHDERKLENICAYDSPTGYCYSNFKHDEFDKIELDENDTDVYVTEEKSEEELVDCLSFAGQQLKVLHVSSSLLLCITLKLYNMLCMSYILQFDL